MRLRWLLAGIFLSVCSLQAEETDSVKVERLLCEAASLPEDSCRTLHFAKQLTGIPYVAGTLDFEDEERLIVHLDKADCTTFVETVAALTIADKRNLRTFPAFKEALQTLRYRGGKLDGYASRLHYFSDWIKDNQEKGLIGERFLRPSRKRTLHLNFMSTHPESYPPLRNDSSLVKEIAKQEQHWQGVEVSYLPKEKLNLPADSLDIHNGDILAITTHIKGLDVVHVGFACWVEERLHLLHASSVAGKVLLDAQSLYEYSKNKKAHTGVRAIYLK